MLCQPPPVDRAGGAFADPFMSHTVPMPGFSTVNASTDLLVRRDRFLGGIGLAIAVLLVASLVGCQPSGNEPTAETAPPVVEVTALDYAFVGPGEVYAAADAKLPDWSENAEAVTGRGLVSPGRTTEKTVYLGPGTHAMYCFVKSPDGQPTSPRE